METSSRDKHVKLVIGGGGIPGIFAFAGAAQCLLDSGYTVDAVSGVSAGAIVAAAIARDLPLERTVTAMGPKIEATLVPYALLKNPPYSYSNDKVQELLAAAFPGNFGTVHRLLFIVTSNITTRQQMVWSSRQHSRYNLAELLYASMAIPGAFRPARINDCWHVDGGICSNNPIDDSFGSDPSVIAIVGSRSGGGKDPNGPLDFFKAVIDTSITHNQNEDRADVVGGKVIEVPLIGETLAFRPSKRFIQINWNSGYKAGARYVWAARRI